MPNKPAPAILLNISMCEDLSFDRIDFAKKTFNASEKTIIKRIELRNMMASVLFILRPMI